VAGVVVATTSTSPTITTAQRRPREWGDMMPSGSAGVLRKRR
jgi:hypothetical protein